MAESALPEMAYVAVRPLRISGQTYEPGQVVPDDVLEGFGGRLTRQGKLTQVPKQLLSEEQQTPSDPYAGKPTFEGRNADESKKQVAATESVEELEALRAWEEDTETGKTRSSVVDAIDKRLEELKGEETAREQELRDSAPNPDDFDNLDAMKEWADTLTEKEQWVIADEVLAAEQEGQNRTGANELLEAKIAELNPEESDSDDENNE